MMDLFDRFFGRSSNKGSGNTAKERLRFVLVHDRMNLSAEQMQAMKAEILAVISKYVNVDDEHVDIALHQRDRDSLLVAEVPFMNVTESDEARRRMNEPQDKNLDDG